MRRPGFLAAGHRAGPDADCAGALVGASQPGEKSLAGLTRKIDTEGTAFEYVAPRNTAGSTNGSSSALTITAGVLISASRGRLEQRL